MPEVCEIVDSATRMPSDIFSGHSDVGRRQYKKFLLYVERKKVVEVDGDGKCENTTPDDDDTSTRTHLLAVQRPPDRDDSFSCQKNQRPRGNLQRFFITICSGNNTDSLDLIGVRKQLRKDELFVCGLHNFIDMNYACYFLHSCHTTHTWLVCFRNFIRTHDTNNL